MTNDELAEFVTAAIGKFIEANGDTSEDDLKRLKYAFTKGIDFVIESME